MLFKIKEKDVMSTHKFTEPCMCGADDCSDCHPENFKNGRYIEDCEEGEKIEEDCDDFEEPDDYDYRDCNGDSLDPDVAAAEFGGMDIPDSRY